MGNIHCTNTRNDRQCRTNGYDTKIYNWKFYDGNNNLVRNFIPCLDTNDVPCFYDSVNKQTYYNRGTGTFDYELL